MKDIAIVGAGGLGREVLVLLHQINEVTPEWNILGFYDDDPALSGKQINGYPLLGTIADLAALEHRLHVVVALGMPWVKEKVVSEIQKDNLTFPSLIHPLSQPKPYQSIRIERGTIVLQGAVLTTNIHIGKYVLIYINCTVAHDTKISAYSSLLPGVNVAGNASIGERVLVGANSAILQGLSIGHNSKIGAGAVVTKSIPEDCTAVGVPAQIIKRYAL